MYNQNINLSQSSDNKKENIRYIRSLTTNKDDLVKKINESIANIRKEIKSYYVSQEEQLFDIDDVYNKVKLGFETLSAAKIAITKIEKSEERMKLMDKYLSDLNIDALNQDLLSIKNNVLHLQSLKIENHQEIMNSLKWDEELSDILKHLRNSYTWYNFLNNLYNTLSNYDVQKDITRYTDVTTDLKNNIEIEENESEQTKNSLKQFLGKVVAADSEKEYNNIKDVKLDNLKLRYLSKLLDLALNYNIDLPPCDSETRNLVVKRPFVKLSDVANITCHSIEIYALNKVFIDANLNKIGDQVQVSIISPTWEIIGSRKIILDGKPGEIHKPEKADDGSGVGFGGQNGKAGNPGGSAGNFLGIGKTFINGQYLSISANGGEGGPGQDGGDGGPGKDGLSPDLPTKEVIPCNENACDEYNKKYGFNCTYIKDYFELPVDNFLPFPPEKFYTFEISGAPGRNGEDGGQGGMSGKGGNAGQIIIEQLNDNSEIIKSNDPGKSGKEGIGGHGGVGGVTEHFKVSCSLYKDSYDVVDRRPPLGIPGNKGLDGASDQDLQEPDEVTALKSSLVINKYKAYVRKNLKGNIKQTSLKAFLNQLENDKKITDLYDLFGLIDDLQELENKFYKLRKEISFLPFYKSLLRRISEYAGSEKGNSSDEKLTAIEKKKVLSYLYTATLSKICSIDNNLGDDLVVDIKKYLTSVLKDIKKLKKLENIVSSDTYQRQFQEEIAAKTKEANGYIQTEITPEINKNIHEIESQIVLLINETVVRENLSKEEREKAIQDQVKLKNLLVVRQLLGAVKLATQFLSFIGPIGATTGAAIGTGIMTYETLQLDDESSTGTNKITQLPGAVKNSVTKMSEQLKNKQQLFKEEINHVDEKLKEFSEEEQKTESLKNIKEKIESTKSKLDEELRRENLWKGYMFQDDEFISKEQHLKEELKELYEKEKKALDEKKVGVDETIDRQIRFVNYAQNMVSIGEMSVDFYGRIKNDQAKIDKLDGPIKEASDNIKEMIKYEEDIYNIIIPTCKSLNNTAKVLESKLKNQSHVALDINKWKIQSTIKDVKFLMQKMTTGFKVQQDLIHYIEKLEDSMSVMIQMYDRMQYYYDKSELASYITNILSDKAEQIVINDKGTRDAVNNLRLTIQSNLILEKYEVAMNAFRQFVFPFAHRFLAEFYLPPTLKSNDTASIISYAVGQIDSLKNKLLVAESTSNPYGKDIASHTTFDSSGDDFPSFLVWDHARNSHLISKILEGKEITIKADITQGLKLNAIKFNEIGINFKLKNAKKQRKLNEILQHFKLSMTHLGNSYYRCNNKYYVISNRNQTISYHLRRNNEGKLIHTFEDYDTIKYNKPVLSPYAMWKIMLTNITDSFDSLSEYKNKPIDLELIGRGQYVNDGIDVCNANLKKYYTESYDVSGTSNIDVYRQETSLDDITSNNHRVRRSLSKDDLTQQINENRFITSGDHNKNESSLMENVLSIIRNTSTALKNPISQIAKWFNISDSNIPSDQVQLNEVHHNYSKNLDSLNVPSLKHDLLKLLSISNDFKNNETYNTINNIVNNSLLHNTNLLLLDLLIRQKTGVKYNDKVNMNSSNASTLEDAQNLAYQYYVPK